METLVITIRPRQGEDLLRVEDAMQQVLDLLRLHTEARSGVPGPEEAFEWTLERASTNSPFTVTVRADPKIPGADVTDYVRQVSREFSTAMTDLTERGRTAWWMDAEALGIAARVLKRNENGVGETEVRGAGIPAVRIDRERAMAGVRTIQVIDVAAIEAGAGESAAWGQIDGVLDRVDKWYRQPAIRISTAQYGQIVCVLSKEVAGPFGHETTIEDAWTGRRFTVEGKFIYREGGILRRIIATAVTASRDVPNVNLEAIRDTTFTDGLDPVEYLRRLHEGELD